MTEKLLVPAEGDCVWHGPSMARQNGWIHQLSASDLAEIDQALSHIKASGLPALSLGKTEFPLPTLGPRLQQILAEVQHGRGFAVLRGLQTERYSREDLEAVYWGIGSYMGRPISQNGDGQLLAEVTDKGSSYSTNVNDRGYRSRDKLNPHVDTSDMTALLCVRQADDGGLSSVASSAAIYNEILSRRPDLLDVYYLGFHHDLRGEGPTGSFDEVTHERIPVFSYHAGLISCCYNDKIMRSAHEKCGKPLSEREVEAIDLLLEVAESPEVRLDFTMSQGDIQFINNYSLLHFRSAFESHPNPEQRRLLLRMWMNNYEPRPLAADFSDRYNTGPRGGVFSKTAARAAE